VGNQWRILIVGATEIIVKCSGLIIRFMLANAYNYKGCDVQLPFYKMKAFEILNGLKFLD
jgi:hypothetical protein